jgi:glycosyltransferase involved in cell wall biosynthesis
MLDAPRPPARLLYVINDLGLGGAQRVVLHQAGALDRERFDVEVATFEFATSGAMIPAFEAAGLRVHRLRAPHEPAWRGLPRLDGVLAERRPDLVHTHLAAAGVLARLAARRRRVPRVVTTLHNVSDWEEKRGSALRWIDRRTLALADRVVTVSDAIRRAVVRVSPALETRTVTVRNGVPLEELLGAGREREASRAALGYRPEHFVIGTVARLDPRKGVDTLLEAFALAASGRPELRALVIGDGPERARLLQLARTLGIDARVQWIHDRADVRVMLAAMDVFAAPSRTEGLGLAVIEALAVGLPVIGSAVGGIPEVLEDGVCGRLLPAEQPRVWGEALAHAATRPPELARWAATGPGRARHFSLEASTRALERVYEELLGVPEPTEAAVREAA